MTELKPCPFCGGEASIYHGDSTDGYIKGADYVLAFCGWCGASIREKKEDEVIKKWNTRPNPWHTGTPTDRDGIFLIQTKRNNLFLVRWADGFWEETNGDDCLEDNDVVAWQKIEPYKEKE